MIEIVNIRVRRHAFAILFLLFCMGFTLGFAKSTYALESIAPVVEDVDPKGFGLAVGPSTIRFKGTAGEPQTATIQIWNHGKRGINVTTELSDVANVTDPTGRLDRRFLPAGTVPYSCGKWIVMEGQEFVVEPQTHRDIPVTISPAADATGATACVIFFRGQPILDSVDEDAPDKPMASVVIQPRLGVLIFFEIKGSVVRSGELLSIDYDPPTEDTPLVIRYEFANYGNADILLTGNFHILDEDKALVGKGEIQPIRTFPGDKGRGETQWSGFITPGQFEMIVTLELGPDANEVIVKELSLDIE